jgi:hypothetical protein
VITPQAPIPDGHTFTITVNYTGTPGVHYDGDGSAEGWFRAADGNWMATEPVGSEDWMPLNDYPSAKPTYDFSVTTELGKTAIANGQRVSVTDNPPDAAFPNGSTTTVWHAPMPIASYLPLTIVGDYTARVHTVDGRRYYEFQDRHLPARLRATNAAAMAMQPGITLFEERFTGPFPFASDGIVAGSPGTRSGEEEMESMIVFPGNGLGLVDVGGLYHENFHQWWGDNVSDGNFDMTFFKEGMATLVVQLYSALEDARKAGGPDTTAGRAAFEHYLVHEFNSLYASGPGAWQLAPSNRSRPAGRACRSSSSSGSTRPTTAPSRRSPGRGCTATRSTPTAARRPAVADRPRPPGGRSPTGVLPGPREIPATASGTRWLRSRYHVFTRPTICATASVRARPGRPP